AAGCPASAVLGLLAARGTIAFLSYCVYFDWKRHGDPAFKLRLREKRRARQQKVEGRGTKVQCFSDAEVALHCGIQQRMKNYNFFCKREHQMGVKHLRNALLVCGQPQEPLKVFKHTLPPKVFEMLLHKIPLICQ
ncbi:hypothetical protein DBR06_SOUSAS1310061, partial [Sousa chinensis]